MAALSEASSAFHNPSRHKPWSLLTADKDATRIKKTARALLRAAFINGCRFRFHRYTPKDEQRKGFVVGLRKALGARLLLQPTYPTAARCSLSGVQTQVACNKDDNNHYADDVENVHCVFRSRYARFQYESAA